MLVCLRYCKAYTTELAQGLSQPEDFGADGDRMGERGSNLAQ